LLAFSTFNHQIYKVNAYKCIGGTKKAGLSMQTGAPANEITIKNEKNQTYTTVMGGIVGKKSGYKEVSKHIMKTLETRITDTIKFGDNLFWQIIKSEEDVGLRHLESDIEYNDSIEINKYRFSELINSLLKLVLVFIEKQNLPLYLDKFRNEIINKLTDEYLFEIKNDPELPESSKLIEDVREFLYPFAHFDSASDDLNYKRFGLKYLENILNQTGYIINQSDKIPTKETDVYNAVKTVINSTFLNSHEPGSNFRKIGKQYKPDILVPELEVAIEYKYGDSEQKIIKCIEQIIVDVHGYQKDKTYKIFYAVFYVKNDVIGKLRFDEIWKEYNFPNNWKPIYCIGK
jgi:hypothetical protein